MSRYSVIDEDIKNGRQCSECFCPVALAIKRAEPGRIVRVSGTGIYIENTRFALHEKVYSFIKRFDAGYPVEPFEFEL